MDPAPSPPVASNATTTKISARPPATNGAVSSGRLVDPAQALMSVMSPLPYKSVVQIVLTLLNQTYLSVS